jgi:hypothetical protein
VLIAGNYGKPPSQTSLDLPTSSPRDPNYVIPEYAVMKPRKDQPKLKRRGGWLGGFF